MFHKMKMFYQIPPRISVPPDEEAIGDRSDLTMEQYSFFVGRFLHRQYLRLAATAMTKIPQTGSPNILDIGCGPGWLAIILARMLPHAKIVGVDLSGDMIRVAEKNRSKEDLPNLVFFQGDALKLARAEFGCFHLVVSNGSLQHWPDPDGVFRSIHGILEREGTALISDLRRDLGLRAQILFHGLSRFLRIIGPIERTMADGWKYATVHGYTKAEAELIAARSPFSSFTIHCGDLMSFTLDLRK